MKTNYLCGLFLLCVLVWGRSEAHAEKPLKTLDLYLCLQAPQGQRPHHRRHEPQPC